MLEKDLSIFDYRKEKEKLNNTYVIDEQVNGRFTKHSIRTEQAGYIDCYLYRPENASDQKLPIIINLHGGGFVLGYCEQDGLYCQQLANACQCCVINIDYCLAPEFKFPKAIYSTYHVIYQLKQQAKQLNLDAEKISIIGHSAGGNIACSLALLDNVQKKLHFERLVLNYPMLDMEEIVEAKQLEQITPVNKRGVDYINWYLTSDGDANDPLASPINGNLSELPETFILGAELDPLLNKERDFFNKAKEAGSSILFKEYKGCQHGFTHKWFKEFHPEKSAEAWEDIYLFFQTGKIKGVL